VLHTFTCCSSSDHRAVYVQRTKEVILYGGFGYLQEQPESITVTWPFRTLGAYYVRDEALALV
jgi:hypothetical protein